MGNDDWGRRADQKVAGGRVPDDGHPDICDHQLQELIMFRMLRFISISF